MNLATTIFGISTYTHQEFLKIGTGFILSIPFCVAFRASGNPKVCENLAIFEVNHFSMVHGLHGNVSLPEGTASDNGTQSATYGERPKVCEFLTE